MGKLIFTQSPFGFGQKTSFASSDKKDGGLVPKGFGPRDFESSDKKVTCKANAALYVFEPFSFLIHYIYTVRKRVR